MSRKRNKKRRPIQPGPRPTGAPAFLPDFERAYHAACSSAMADDRSTARQQYQELLERIQEAKSRALVENDLGTLAALDGNLEVARAHFQRALADDPECAAAQANLALLEQESASAVSHASDSVPTSVPSDNNGLGQRPTKVAILSLLFNWPSTGGGTIHTAELGKFLGQAGYDVRHIYAQYAAWGVGQVTAETGVPSTPLSFEETTWNAPAIQQRFRAAVDAFQPDYVIITDSWNFKPLLAEAVDGYRYFLRLAAQECLCPLNNVRLLVDDSGAATACPKHQLATADACRQCVATNGRLSGGLHQAERALSVFGTSDYERRLRDAFAQAEGILVVNPQIAAMVAPYAKAVHVVPSGFDSARFPWPWPDEESSRNGIGKTRLLFAGLTHEFMKGFHVLRAACQKLWEKRQDFELVVTGDAPAGETDRFITYIGWQSQEELPRQLRQADVLIFPTIAEEALGRSAVEAMGVGRPVIASRIGGLPYTVIEGLTGLLFEPGNVNDLAHTIERLLDDSDLRRRMGENGRERFEQHYTWDVIIDRHYRSMLAPPPAPTLSVTSKPNAFAPQFVMRVDHQQLLTEAAGFFGLLRADAQGTLRDYHRLHEAQGYTQTLGEWKTLTFEESFLIGLHWSLVRPATVVEIGSGTGRASRRLVDLQQWLGLNPRMQAYDVNNELQHVRLDELEFHAKDLHGWVRREILDRYGEGFIFVDVHDYALLREIITETLAHYGAWSLAIHDCGRGLCNPRMTLAKDDSAVTSLTGVWERHVLADALGIADPLSMQLDQCSTATHRLKIFETQHGLAFLMPVGLLGPTGGNGRPNTTNRLVPV
jgi:glycosyltransferase involved in cell wall biosynthesis